MQRGPGGDPAAPALCSEIQASTRAQTRATRATSWHPGNTVSQETDK